MRKVALVAAVITSALLLGIATPSASTTVTDTWATGDGPGPVAVSPDGSRVFVGNRLGNTVQVFSPSGVLERTLTGFNDPNSLAISPDGQWLAVVNQGSNTVSVIATSTWAASTVNVGATPIGMAIDSSSTTAYVGSFIDRTATPITLASATAGAAIPLGLAAGFLTLSPDDSTLYVTDAAGLSRIAVVTLSGPTVTNPTVGKNRSIAISPDGATGYIAASGSAEVTVFRTSDGAVLYSWPLADDPNQVALSPDGRTLAATVDNDTVALFTTALGAAATPTIASTGATPEGVAFSPDGSTIYVANFNADTVTVVMVTSDSEGGPTPPDVLQQVEDLSGDCPSFQDQALNWSGVRGSGWSASWAQWARTGSGGPVCTRTLYYSGGGRWAVR